MVSIAEIVLKMQSLMQTHFEALLFISCILLYMNTLYGSYVWDDRAAILGNGDVTQSNGLIELFRHDFWGQNLHDTWSHKSYRPLTTLTFRMNHAIHGLSAGGFHFVNILLYGIGVILMYRVCRRWLSTEQAARAAAALYCYHPVHVEAVASLVGRADSLCGLFFMYSILAYSESLRYWVSNGGESGNQGGPDTSRGKWLFARSITAAFASSMAKEIGVTAFGILVVLEVASSITRVKKDAVHNNENHGRVLTFYNGFSICWEGLAGAIKEPFSASQVRIGFVILTLAVMSIMRVYINGPQSLYQWSHLENHIAQLPTFAERVYSYAQTHFWYLMKLVYPRHLCFDYGFSCIPTIHSLLDIRNMLPAAAYSCVIGALFVAISSVYVPVLVGLGLLIIPLVPALNILFPVGTTLAERLLFIPSAGFCMIVSELLQYYFMGGLCTADGSCVASAEVARSGDVRNIPSSKHRLEQSKVSKMNLFIALVCSIFSIRVITRNRDWNSESQIYESALRVCPLSAKALTNYAVLHMDSENIHNAAAAAFSSVELYDNQAPAWLNAGVVLQRLGYFARSAHFFEESLVKNRSSGKMFGYLGSAYYEWSLKVADDPTAPNGWVQELRRRASQAMDQAFRDGFSPPATLHSRGSLALDMGDPHAAIQYFQKALTLTAQARSMDPDVPHSDLVNEAFTLNQLGNVYSSMGNHEEAIALYLKGLEMEPEAQSLLVNLGSSLRALNRFAEAKVVLEQVISVEEARGDLPSVAVLNNLALVELETENFDAAEALLKRAIILQNDSQISMDSLENNDGKSIHLRVSESHEESIQTLIERNLERVKQERLEKTGQT